MIQLRSKKITYSTVFLLLIAAGLFVFHRPILDATGRFMAPVSEGKADVLILEGDTVITNGAMNTGMKLLSEGRANRMVVVLHQPSEEGQAFALEGKQAQLIMAETERKGVEKGKVEVISASTSGHPVTLSEARFVIARLSRDGVRSAILLANGFHTRRSLAVYRQEGARLGLRVVPYPYFVGYGRESWWRDTQGVNGFMLESCKLAYYLLHGYVSIKWLL